MIEMIILKLLYNTELYQQAYDHNDDRLVANDVLMIDMNTLNTCTVHVQLI